MYCRNCGKENKDEQRFCRFCGHSLHDDIDYKTRSATKHGGTQRRQTPLKKVESSDEPARNRKVSRREKKSLENNGTGKLLTIVVVSMAVMVMVALGIFLGLYLGHKGEPNSTTEQMSGENAREETQESEESGEDKDVSDDTSDNNLENEKDTSEVLNHTDEESDEVITKESEVEELSEEISEIKIGISYSKASSELDVESSDNATYYSENLYDSNYKTAWVEGVEGNGVGETISLKLDGTHKISRLIVYNGFLKTKRRYAINGKVATALIDYGNGNHELYNLNIMDVPEEDVDFEPYGMGETEIIPGGDYETDEITITIMGAQAGSKYSDTAISEIEVFGY